MIIENLYLNPIDTKIDDKAQTINKIYVKSPNGFTQSNPKYEKWNLGFMYNSAIQPFSQNLIMLINIKSPKAILKTTSGLESHDFDKYELIALNFINMFVLDFNLRQHQRNPH